MTQTNSQQERIVMRAPSRSPGRRCGRGWILIPSGGSEWLRGCATSSACTASTELPRMGLFSFLQAWRDASGLRSSSEGDHGDLLQINVSDHTETKNGLTYLSGPGRGPKCSRSTT